MKRLLITTFLALSFITSVSTAQTSAAGAGGELPEYFWQPAEFQNALIPGISYIRSKGDLTGGTTVTDTNTNFGVRYERGFSDMFALGFGLGYLTGNSESATGGTTTTYTRSGLTDLGLALKGFTPMSFGRLFFGMNASVNLGKATLNVGDKKYNASEGGYTLAPYVGFGMDTTMGVVWGGRLEYALRGERTLERSNPTSAAGDLKITGGNTMMIEGFIEYPYGTMTPGLALGYATADKAEVKQGGTSVSESGSASSLAGRVYANFELTPTMEVQPRIVFGRERPEESAGNTGSNNVNAFGGGVDLRYLF